MIKVIARDDGDYFFSIGSRILFVFRGVLRTHVYCVGSRSAQPILDRCPEVRVKHQETVSVVRHYLWELYKVASND